MAFPSVRSSRLTAVTSNATGWTLVFPFESADIKDGGASYVQAGDLILVNIGRDGTSGTGSLDSGFGSALLDLNQTTTCRGLCFAKVASGSEGDIAYTVGASEQGVARIAVFKDWYGSLAGVEVVASAVGSSSAPDVGTGTPSWGAADTYWRWAAANDSGLVSVNAYPTNFTDNQNADASGGGSGASLGGAGYKLNAASLNPAAGGLSSSEQWVCWLVAIRPYEGPPPYPDPLLAKQPHRWRGGYRAL